MDHLQNFHIYLTVTLTISRKIDVLILDAFPKLCEFISLNFPVEWHKVLEKTIFSFLSADTLSRWTIYKSWYWMLFKSTALPSVFPICLSTSPKWVSSYLVIWTLTFSLRPSGLLDFVFCTRWPVPLYPLSMSSPPSISLSSSQDPRILHCIHFTRMHFTRMHFTRMHFTRMCRTLIHRTRMHHTQMHWTRMHHTWLHTKRILGDRRSCDNRSRRFQNFPRFME